MSDQQRTPEVIEPGRLYSTAEARSRLRLGPVTWRTLVRSGLPVHRLGKGSYVYADDLIEAIRRQHREAATCG
jgi:hypothetical protein